MGQESSVAALFLQSGLTADDVRADLAGIPRALVAKFPSMKMS
jgi:hypothetical protein